MPVDYAVAHEARRQADLQRGKVLARLTHGECTMWDVIRDFDRGRDKTIGRITIKKLLRCAGVPPRRTGFILTQLAYVAGEKKTSGKMNLAWLCDRKVGSQRLVSLVGCMATERVTPWEGFPFTTPPVDLDAIAQAWRVPRTDDLDDLVHLLPSEDSAVTAPRTDDLDNLDDLAYLLPDEDDLA